MKKIVDIRNNIVYIGNEDGGLQEVRLEDCSFEPAIGDSVNVFSSETKTIVTKIEMEAKPVEPVADRVHVNIVNENNNSIEQPISAGGKVVNKAAYCILAFFFGSFGFHKFYAGKVALGLIYLFFCWTFIPGLIAGIECFVALFKPSDSHGNIVV
mgnify:CR=1 FL=1